MEISKVILTFGLLIMAFGIASFGVTQSVHGDYGLAANKLKQKAQQIQNRPNRGIRNEEPLRVLDVSERSDSRFSNKKSPKQRETLSRIDNLFRI